MLLRTGGIERGWYRTAIGALVPGPAALASITHSMGLEYGVFWDGSPANENVRCGPLIWYDNASVNGFGWSNASWPPP